MRYAIIILMTLVLANCSNDDKDVNKAEYFIGDSALAWDTNLDSMIMRRDTTIPDSAITIKRIINGLNEKYPEVHIDFLKQSGDTAYAGVPDADYLGEFLIEH